MMTVAEAAIRLGISASSLRHYEKQFGLRFARTKGGQRLLSERDLDNIRIIRSFRGQNVPVEEIRQKLAVPVGEVETVRPGLEEVVEALVARQDELERIVKAQQALLKHLSTENQRLALAQEHVKLLLEAPKDPDPLVLELAEQMAAIESHHGEELRGLQTRLESLVQEVQAEASEEETIAAEPRSAEAEQLKGLQRRMLDLETAVATREDPPEEGLLDTLVSAIVNDARRRRPWWKFW